jgi:hypothetical protein
MTHWLHHVEGLTTNYRFIPIPRTVWVSPWAKEGETREDTLRRLQTARMIKGTLSGAIDYELVARAPILPGADERTIELQHGGKVVVYEPTRLGDQLFISGRTIKGMIRSVFAMATASAFPDVGEAERTMQPTVRREDRDIESALDGSRLRGHETLEGRLDRDGVGFYTTINGVRHSLSKKVIDDFLAAHPKLDEARLGHERSRIRIFVGGNVEDRKIVRTFRLTPPDRYFPGKRKTHNLAPIPVYRSSLDWADAMFGQVREGDGVDSALGGRVSFSFAKASPSGDDHEFWPADEKTFSMPGAAPKPNFSPFYLANSGENQGMPSYDRQDVELAGYKRVPVVSIGQSAHLKMLEGIDAGHDRVAKPINPKEFNTNYHNQCNQLRFAIAKEADKPIVFKGRIKFRNLTAEELGALLWSLSFGDENAFKDKPGGQHWHTAGRLKEGFLGTLQPRAVDLHLMGKDDGGDPNVYITNYETSRTIAVKTDIEPTIQALLLATDSKSKKVNQIHSWLSLSKDHGLKPLGSPNFQFYSQIRQSALSGRHVSNARHSIRAALMNKGGLLRL